LARGGLETPRLVEAMIAAGWSARPTPRGTLAAVTGLRTCTEIVRSQRCRGLSVAGTESRRGWGVRAPREAPRLSPLHEGTRSRASRSRQAGMVPGVGTRARRRRTEPSMSGPTAGRCSWSCLAELAAAHRAGTHESLGGNAMKSMTAQPREFGYTAHRVERVARVVRGKWPGEEGRSSEPSGRSVGTCAWRGSASAPEGGRARGVRGSRDPERDRAPTQTKVYGMAFPCGRGGLRPANRGWQAPKSRVTVDSRPRAVSWSARVAQRPRGSGGEVQRVDHRRILATDPGLVLWTSRPPEPR